MHTLYEEPYKVFNSVEELLTKYFRQELFISEDQIEKLTMVKWLERGLVDLKRLSSAKSLDRLILVVYPAPEMTGQAHLAGLRIELESPDFVTKDDLVNKPMRAGYRATYQVVINVSDENHLHIEFFNYLGLIALHMVWSDVDSITPLSADKLVEHYKFK